MDPYEALQEIHHHIHQLDHLFPSRFCHETFQAPDASFKNLHAWLRSMYLFDPCIVSLRFGYEYPPSMFNWLLRVSMTLLYLLSSFIILRPADTSHFHRRVVRRPESFAWKLENWTTTNIGVIKLGVFMLLNPHECEKLQVFSES